MGLREQAEIRFGERVREERERRGWSQEELAKRLTDRGIEGVYASTVAKIESTGKPRAVRLAEAAAVAELFEVSLDTLLGRTTNPPNDRAFTLRGVLDTAQQCSSQLHGIENTLSERFMELRNLDFEGLEELQTEAAAAAKGLKVAREALARIAMFRMAAMAGIKLRFDGKAGAMFNTMISEMLEADVEAES